jgi:CubicO group peptidase (beta-lactamase class C family)
VIAIIAPRNREPNVPRLLLFALILATSSVIAPAAPPPAERMDQIARYYVDAQQFMGAVLVTHGDEVLFSKAYGAANLEWNIPNTLDTKFRIGSMTKQFTASGVLLLEERGKLGLDDPIKNYYASAPASWDKITLRHLLGHTSGIPNYTNTPDFGRMSSWHATPTELVERVRDKPLEFEPGAQMRYSNTGYVLLGMVIEKASGTSYQAFLKQNIFDPLGMKDTGYDDNSTVLPRRAAGYTPSANGISNAIYVDMTTPFAAGALYSTAPDLQRWELALFGKRLISAASLDAMTTKGKGDYGMGLFIGTESGRRRFEHGGGIPGFNAKMSYYPDTGVAVIALSNLNGPGPDDIVDKLGALAHGDAVVLLSERKSISLPEKVLRRYIGTYQVEPDRVMTVSYVDGQLQCQLTGDNMFPIAAKTETRFFPLPFDAEFEFRVEKGKVTGLILRQPGGETFAKRL